MKTVKVQITKTYYKSAVIDVDVPEHLTDDEINLYIEKQEAKDSKLSDRLADVSLNEDYGGIEIEVVEF